MVALGWKSVYDIIPIRIHYFCIHYLEQGFIEYLNNKHIIIGT